MTLGDQIRSDPGRICCRVIAWDQALWWGTGEFEGDSLVLHCASLTAHNKMAAVKKSM